MFSPSVRVAFSYAGYPGVVGSPALVLLEMFSIVSIMVFTWVEGDELDRATLHRRRIARWARGVGFVPVLHSDATVIARVRVNQDSRCSNVLRSLDLQHKGQQ